MIELVKVSISKSVIPFHITSTNHIVIKVSLNGVLGAFIIDTGASNSCIGFHNADLFNIKHAPAQELAIGAGSTLKDTSISENNSLQIADWMNDDCTFVVIDLSHINNALIEKGAEPISGIIGADVLIEAQAILDYKDLKLYLQPSLEDGG